MVVMQLKLLEIIILNRKFDPNQDWGNTEETLYLNSIPDFVDSINELRKEDKSKCSIYNKDEEW